MQVTVTGRHFEVTPALRSYAEARLDRMHRYMGRIHAAHVTLSVEKHRHQAEVVLQSEGREFTSKKVSEDMFSALDQVAEKLERQIRRFKDKRTTVRKSAGRRTAAGDGRTPLPAGLRVLRSGSIGKGPHAHEIVSTGEYPIEKLSIDDAILKLEKLDEDFMVFSNRATEAIHVVYKLPDGNYGVLNLEAGP
jgi:putative sigma-54 modulation protein